MKTEGGNVPSSLFLDNETSMRVVLSEKASEGTEPDRPLAEKCMMEIFGSENTQGGRFPSIYAGSDIPKKLDMWLQLLFSKRKLKNINIMLQR